MNRLEMTTDKDEIQQNRLAFWMRGDVPADNTLYRISIGVAIYGENRAHHDDEIVVANIGGRDTFVVKSGEILSWGSAGYGGGSLSDCRTASELAEHQLRHYLGVAFGIARALVDKKRKDTPDERSKERAQMQIFLAAASLLKTYFGKEFISNIVVNKLVEGDTAYLNDHRLFELSRGLEELLAL